MCWGKKMIILGHDLVPYKPYYFIQNTDQIPTNDKTILFDFNEDLIKYCQLQKINFAIKIKDKTQAVIANAVGAEAIICPFDLAKEVQKLAEYYLFDSKIAIITQNIKKAIDLKVDMAILPNAIR